jgi:hypothetical protein
MAVVIGEIITEVALTGTTDRAVSAEAGQSSGDMDDVVRQATERVLEVLRREWDR